MKVVKTRAYKEILKGHKSPVLSLSSPYGPNSGYLFSLSSDGLIRVWNLMERKIESKIILSRYSNETVKDDLYIGLDIADLQLEEIPQNNEERKIELTKENITASLFGENCVYGGYEDGLICCWNIKSGELLYKMEGHTKKIIQLIRISPGTILSSSNDKTIKLWDTMNGNLESEYIFDHIIHSIFFYGDTIYAIGDHSFFFRIHYQTHKMQPPINFNNISITSLLIYENFVLFTTFDSFIQIHELSDLNDLNFLPKKLIPVNGNWLNCMKKLNDYLILGCDDRMVRVFSLKTYKLLEEFFGHEDSIISLEIADGMLFSGSNDHSIRSWDLKEMENRIRERKFMIREDINSRKFEAYSSVIEKKKKKKKGKKGKKGKKKGSAKKK